MTVDFPLNLPALSFSLIPSGSCFGIRARGTEKAFGLGGLYSDIVVHIHFNTVKLIRADLLYSTVYMLAYH